LKSNKCEQKCHIFGKLQSKCCFQENHTSANAGRGDILQYAEQWHNSNAPDECGMFCSNSSLGFHYVTRMALWIL